MFDLFYKDIEDHKRHVRAIDEINMQDLWEYLVENNVSMKDTLKDVIQRMMRGIVENDLNSQCVSNSLNSYKRHMEDTVKTLLQITYALRDDIEKLKKELDAINKIRGNNSSSN